MKSSLCKEYLEKRFKTAFKCVVLYKNPLPYKIFLERINPNHVGIVWGLKRKRDSRGNNPIKIAKVYFGMTPFLILLMLSPYVEQGFAILANVCNATMCICFSAVFLYYGFLLKGVKISSLA